MTECGKMTVFRAGSGRRRLIPAGESTGVSDYERKNLCVPHILPCICDLFEGTEPAPGEAGAGHFAAEQNVHRFRAAEGAGGGCGAVRAGAGI